MPVDRQVHIKVREVYGMERIYPVCANAMLFAEMTRRRCLTRQDLGSISELGFSVVQMNDSVVPQCGTCSEEVENAQL